MSFEDDLLAAQSAPVEFRDVRVMIAGKLHMFRFNQMNGMEWAAECDRHPQRPGVLLDMRYGYNLRTLTKAAAPKCGGRIVDDAVVPLRVDPFVKGSKEPRVDEWALVFTAISGHDFQRISDAIFDLNQYSPEQAVELASKALADSESISA